MRIIYTYLIFISILTFSCVGEVNNYDTGTENDLTQTHKYDKPIEEEEDFELRKPTDLNIRNNWQKPEKVLQRLENIHNKVIADIGAGTGYFSIRFLFKPTTKVIAIDIDQAALDSIQATINKINVEDDIKNKLETRLVSPDNPNLGDEEVDVVFISNTFSYIEDKVDYLKTVYNGIKPGGRICIVDFKMKRLPSGLFPPVEDRIPLYQVEDQLEEAGFTLYKIDDRSLAYQYIAIAIKK